jgi:hypothetical protein
MGSKECILIVIFSQAIIIPKYSAEDTTLVTTNAFGEKLSVPVPQGTSIVLHTPGLHYNRLYYSCFSDLCYCADCKRQRCTGKTLIPSNPPGF